MDEPAPRRPTREGSQDGLAYALWLPGTEETGGGPSAAPDPPWPAVVILHGAGSCKENHADFARLAARSGWAALTFDARGHGASAGEMSPAAIGDAVRMARLLAEVEGVDPRRIATRGSSMGGYFAIHAAAISEQIAGVIAICPAGEEHLRSGLREERLEMPVDVDALDAWLGEHDLRDAVERLGGRPLILLHAEGDDEIPCDWSIELFEHASEPRKLVLVPGGDHRSIQHDAELQAVALRWLQRRLEAAPRKRLPELG